MFSDKFKRKAFFVSMLLGALWLTACEGLPVRQAEAPAARADAAEGAGERPAELPFAEPSRRVTELDADLVYNVLLGEIASQRGDMEQALASYLEAARMSGDAATAERASRIAIFLKDQEQAIEVIGLWVELSPNDPAARLLAAVFFMEAGRDDEVFEQLKAVISIQHAKGESGFVQALTALSRSQDAGRVIGLMRRLAAEYPGDREADYAVALAASVMKQTELAVQEARSLVDRYPDFEKGYVLLSRVYLAADDNPAAKAVLGRAVDLFPASTILHSAYGKLLVDMQQVEEAYRQFLTLKRLAPDQPDISLTLGVLAMQQERFDLARQHLQDEMALSPASDKAAYYLGRIAEVEGAAGAAIDWFSQVEEGELGYDARVRTARLTAQVVSLDEARDLLRALRISYPKHSIELYLVEAELYKEVDEVEQAMLIYEQGLTAYPGDVDLLYARALTAVTRGRVDVLEQDLKAILEKEPEHADALNALGYTLADQTDRYQEALGYIQKALALKPDAPAILDSMGWVQFRLGNHAEALDYLRRASALLQDSEIAAHLGEVLWVTGERGEARQIWDQALELDPGNQYLLKTMERLAE